MGIEVVQEISSGWLPSFFDVLASTYGPELAAPGPLIIWKNILCQVCSRIMYQICSWSSEHYIS